MEKKKILFMVAGVIGLIAIGIIAYALTRQPDGSPNSPTGKQNIGSSSADVYKKFSIAPLYGVSFVVTTTAADGSVSTTETDKNGNSRSTHTINGKKSTRIAIGDTVYECTDDKDCTTVDSTLTPEQLKGIQDMGDRVNAKLEKNAKFVGKVSCPGGTCAEWKVEGADTVAGVYTFFENGRIYKIVTDGKYGSTQVYEYKDVTIKAPSV